MHENKKSAPQFQERGQATTRVEGFTDAAFAFALTMLVISFDEVPTSMDELMIAVKRIPAFAAGFAQIAMFWHAHHRWSRRYGLDDSTAVFLSLLLVFITLIYVFPVRVIYSGLFTWITNGYFPFEFTSIEVEDWRTIWVIYGLGFIAMSGVIVWLYQHAYRLRHQLGLSEPEAFEALSFVRSWIVVTLSGVISIILAMTLPSPWHVFSWMPYALLGFVMPLMGWRFQVVAERRFGELP